MTHTYAEEMEMIMAKTKSDTEFAENSEGVHVVTPLQGEHTLCGDAFEQDDHIGTEGWMPTRKRVVTCHRCALVILACRGVRLGVNRPKSTNPKK